MNVQPHPNILPFYGFCDEKGHKCLVLEFFSGGSLLKVIQNNPGTSFETRLAILSQAGEGVRHLHSQHDPPIIHRDLACRNILVDKDLTKAVVCDFGMSRALGMGYDSAQTKTSYGPVRWMAPESLSRQEYSVKSDVWA